MKVKTIKHLQYGDLEIKIGEIGEVVNSQNHLYDILVKFGDKSIGLFFDEVEFLDESE